MRFTDLAGTLGSFFRLRSTGVRLKNNGGNLAVRNSGDTADAEIAIAAQHEAEEFVGRDIVQLDADWPAIARQPASAPALALAADARLRLALHRAHSPQRRLLRRLARVRLVERGSLERGPAAAGGARTR